MWCTSCALRMCLYSPIRCFPWNQFLHSLPPSTIVTIQTSNGVSNTTDCLSLHSSGEREESDHDNPFSPARTRITPRYVHALLHPSFMFGAIPPITPEACHIAPIPRGPLQHSELLCCSENGAVFQLWHSPSGKEAFHTNEQNMTNSLDLIVLVRRGIVP